MHKPCPVRTESTSDRNHAGTRETVIRPARRVPLPDFAEVSRHWELLVQMTWRDLRARYQQMALGPLWFVLQPLLTTTLFTILFGKVAKLPSGGVPYAIFTYTALLPWGFFSSVLGSSVSSLMSNRHLLGKVYFPRMILPLSKLLNAFVDLCVSFVILAGMMVYFGYTPSWSVVFLPLALVLAAITGLGVGLCFSGITVKYRDFAELAGLMVRGWMYATPVIYSVEIVPESWRSFYMLNPMAHVVEHFRWVFLGTSPEPALGLTMLPYAVGISLFFLVVGLLVFTAAEQEIADIV